MMEPRAIGWPLIWTLLGFALLLLEGIALGSKQTGDTLSEAIRQHVRFDPVGRFLILPLWFWLTWHWVIRVDRFAAFGVRDVLAIGLGLAYAVLESRRVL
jgi:hypothetical protein